eukprot:2117072-Rhodomonas_salina.1
MKAGNLRRRCQDVWRCWGGALSAHEQRISAGDTRQTYKTDIQGPVMMLERGTQRAYNEASASTADRPSRV